ncbi:hypothetical protein GYMLUDRAFT_632949 [Collybiopsis luxurians FD-317 M1]|nr:hypothetical protein GYMLUDRAFT_632949 [Collybiopsis luxurians FD-317 M1]
MLPEPESVNRPNPPYASTSALLSWPPSALASKANSSLSVNYVPSKFSAALVNPGKFRRRKRRNNVASQLGKSIEVSEDEKTEENKSGKNLRWNKFKWILFFANLLYSAYSLATLIVTLLVWFDVFEFADVVRVGNTTELIFSTLAASIGVLTSVVGWAGILLNNRSFLAVYTFLLWITFAFLLVPGYITYKRRTFNLEGKINLQWSRDLHDDGRLRIQNKLGCCGFFSPFVEATISQTCYSRSVLPGCKAGYLEYERKILERWYLICFCIVPAHIGVMLAALLCSNHVTYRFGKGMTPKAYRLGPQNMAAIAEDYASRLAEHYGPEVASSFLERTRSFVSPSQSFSASPNINSGDHSRVAIPDTTSSATHSLKVA